MLLFTDFELCTQNNAYASSWMKPTRGLHQGCNISPHLYNCCGQVFADLFKRNNKIEGILAQQIINLIAQFVDDTNLFLTATEENIQNVVDILKYAELNLGLKVNYEKTTIYRIGSLCNTDAKLYTKKAIQWQDPPVFTLGLHVSEDMNMMSALNLIPMVEKVETRLKTWQKQDMTLMGRVLIVNTLVESMFIYRMSVLPKIDVAVLDQIQDIIMEFVWNEKRPKLQKELIMAPKHQGGLRLVNLKKKHLALLIQWVFITNSHGDLKESMYAELAPIHPAKTSKNTCDFWDIRKFRLGFTMVVYEKIYLAA